VAILSIQSQASYGYAANSAAVFLSRYLKTGDVRSALELTAASIYGITEAAFIAAQNGLNSPSRSFDAVRF
jgi:pyridoxal/pyridoxine/pyridoxamine kinase